ncbi:tyrosine-type recombinase/integrase [Streptomyces sp. AK02-01A]|uniref:tyrosine-type recombinase/integrase n=1 Tax=Streptomyces sp. AK02-01A TaxID=3028648 RepID=UPI0039F68706
MITSLGHEHLRRHDLRHTGLTWFAGVPAHVLRKIAGHGSPLTTQRYLHPDMTQITNAGNTLTAHLNPVRAPSPSPSSPPQDPARPAGPQPVPKKHGKAAPDFSDTACDLRKRWSGRQDLNLRPLDPQ